SFCCCAFALARLAWSGRSSSVKSNWPALTNWPSLTCTSRTVLVTCGRRSTLLSDTTLPLTCTVTGTLCRLATAGETSAGPSEPLAPLAPLPAAAVAVSAEWRDLEPDHHQLPAAAATTSTPERASTRFFFMGHPSSIEALSAGMGVALRAHRSWE